MKITILKQDIKRFKNCTLAFLEVALIEGNLMIHKTSITGSARCCPEDEYNFKIGKRIALARAEINAYRYYVKFLIEFNDCHQKLATDSADLYDKLRKQISHNKEYIEDIISGSTEIDAGCSAL